MGVMSPLRALRAPAPLAAALLLALAAGRAAAEPRTALIEVFGAPEDSASVAAFDAAAGVAGENSDRISWTQYDVQTASPLGTPSSTDRFTEYGAPRIPIAFVDGEPVIPTGAGIEADVRSYVATSLANPAPLKLDGLFFFDPISNIGSVIVDVAATGSLPEATHDEIRILILEDPVIWCCGPGNEQTWPRVARLTLDPVPLGVAVPGDRFTQQIDFDFDPSWNADHLTGMVIVQRASDHSVIQTAEGRNAGTLPPIPDIPDDPGGTTLFPCRPNPALDYTRISFYVPEREFAKVLVMDVRGAQIRELSAETWNQGDHLLTWDALDSKGRRPASGVYLIVLETARVRTTQRVVLLR